MTRGKQTDLRSALGEFAAKMDRKAGGALLQVRVAEAWEAAAGPAVGEHTTNAYLRGHELVVAVDSPIWATELSALSGRYVEELNHLLGGKVVTSVRFTVSQKVEREKQRKRAEQEAEEFYLQDKVQAIPLSSIERAQIEESVKGIPDPELREAVLRATVADFEWKKGIAAHNARQEPRESL